MKLISYLSNRRITLTLCMLVLWIYSLYGFENIVIDISSFEGIFFMIAPATMIYFGFFIDKYLS